MPKRRTFEKKLAIQNFKSVKTEQLLKSDTLSGKAIKELVEIVVEVLFTPRGYRVDTQLLSPMIVWDFEHTCKLKGITETNPEGDLTDKNFPTELAAMHFVTRRLSTLGWKPINVWEEYD